MPTPLVHAALAALIACGRGDAPSPVPTAPARTATTFPLVAQALEACERYRPVGEGAYGRCLSGRAPVMVTVEEAEDLCGRAGKEEAGCREAWVGPRRQGGQLPIEVELRGCGKNADCALQSLERHPDLDIRVQMQRCRTYVPTHVDYCLGHAVRRWVRTNPAGAEAATVLATADSGMLAGRMLGRWSACQGLDLCPSGSSPGEVTCRSAAESIRAGLEACQDEARTR